MAARSPQRQGQRPAQRHPHPDELRPMLPTLRAEPFDSSDWIFEVKWGGVRAIAAVDDGAVRLHGRNLRDLTPLYPELGELASAFPARHAVIDGEICAWGAEDLPDFSLLRSRLLSPNRPPTRRRAAPLIYQAFDLLELNGLWLLEHPLFERRNILHERLKPSGAVQAADFVREDGIAFFEAAAEHKLEGIVAKDKHSQYVPGERSLAWQEIRATQSDDFVIGGYTFGGGRRKDVITSLLLGVYRGRTLELAGEVSLGCTDREQRQLLELLTPLHCDRPPFSEEPVVSRFLYWCRPELACHVRFSQWGPDGRLRFPVFVAPRPDVPPEECVAAG